MLGAFRNDKVLRDFTGDVLHNPKIKVIDYEGRLYLANTTDRFDIIDLSLADSAGLSNPGGFAIVEKFAYSREAMTSYMRALKDGGILSVTLWNKEEPPKSVLKLYATMAEAARQIDGGAIADRFFVTSSYLSTATVLYKRGGFTPAETTKLREHTRAMSFDEIYYPGFVYDSKETAAVLTDYKNSIFPDGGRTGGPDRVPRQWRQACRGPAGGQRPASGHDHGPDGLAPSRARRLGRHRAALRVRHAPAHQRPALLRGLREAGGSCRASPTGWSCSRTSGAIFSCGRRWASPASPPSRSCSCRWCSAGAPSSAATRASSAPSSTSPAWGPATSWSRWA